jgi:hypothetical protein
VKEESLSTKLNKRDSDKKPPPELLLNKLPVIRESLNFKLRPKPEESKTKRELNKLDLSGRLRLNKTEESVRLE